MITYEEALKLAREYKPDIDTCSEWENGWDFSYSGDEESTGGADTPIVILKETGARMNMVSFLFHGSGELLRSFDI